jgi:hypothetical protein
MARSGQNSNITRLFDKHPFTTMCSTDRLKAVVRLIVLQVVKGDTTWDDDNLKHFLHDLFFLLPDQLPRSERARHEKAEIEHISVEEATAYQQFSPSSRLRPASGTKPWCIDVPFSTFDITDSYDITENYVFYLTMLATPDKFRVQLVHMGEKTFLDVLVSF